MQRLADAAHAERAHRVLLVEDDPSAARSTQLFLRLRGYQVLLAPTGKAGIDLATQSDAQVVLIDLSLPDMSGYDVIRAIRGYPELEGAVFIALSGYGDQDDLQRSREAGFHHHLVKPADAEHLEALFEAVKRHKRR